MELEEGWLHLHPPWLMLPWAPLGRCSGPSPITDFCHQQDVTGSLGLTGTSCPPWGLFCPGPAWPRALASSPGSSAVAEALGSVEGYFTCWHQLFLPSAPNHVTHPQVSDPASCLPSPLASSITGHCCSSATFLLCPFPLRFCPDTCSSVSSPVQEPAALGSYCWVTGGTGRGVTAPQLGFGSWWWSGLKVRGQDSLGGCQEPGSGAWGGGEGRMDCSSGTGSVTGQQWAPL